MSYLGKLVIIIFLITCCSGCQSIDMRGQFVSNESITEINAQKPTKEQLVSLIGTPTYIPNYNNNTWYYIQRLLSRRAWLEPQITEQRVLEITFVDDRVDKATLLHNQQQNIIIQSSHTQTYGTQQSGIQKFVKNIGRFTPKKDCSVKRKKK